EARRLGEALRAIVDGRPPIWPAPSGTVIDELIAPLHTLFTRGAYAPSQLAGGPQPAGALEAQHPYPQIGAPGGGTPSFGAPANGMGNISMPGQPGYGPAGRSQTPGRDPHEAVDALEAQLPEWLRGQRSFAPQPPAASPAPTPLPRFGPQSQQNMSALPYQSYNQGDFAQQQGNPDTQGRMDFSWIPGYQGGPTDQGNSPASADPQQRYDPRWSDTPPAYPDLGRNAGRGERTVRAQGEPPAWPDGGEYSDQHDDQREERGQR
ncbi:MAG TPA: hypothetical protein VKQ36_00620, partial [Ktedonobacterales bacterium]|nr:hypothetical protein [Ktedonobacterales bacterium]